MEDMIKERCCICGEKAMCWRKSKPLCKKHYQFVRVLEIFDRTLSKRKIGKVEYLSQQYLLLRKEKKINKILKMFDLRNIIKIGKSKFIGGGTKNGR